jgi:uncharacterized protein
MNLLLFLSDRCNMTCDYCFLKLNEGPASVLSAEAAKTAVEDHLQRGGDRVTLLGGEPFIHYPLLRELVGFIGGRAKVKVVTNATLASPEKVTALRGMGARITVSLDGTKSSHDVNRHLLSGGSALEESLRVLSGCNLEGLDVNMVVSEATAGKLLSNVEFLRERGFRKIAFHPNVLEKWSKDALESLRKALAKLAKYHKVVGERLELSKGGDSSCDPYDDFVLGADGHYYPCDGLFARTYAELSDWRVGDWKSGLDVKKREAFHAKARKAIHAALGGKPHSNCPRETYFQAVVTGRDPVPALRSFHEVDEVLHGGR